jgi:predicted DCC family thiol-disulfide oxidoreductase YuxK
MPTASNRSAPAAEQRKFPVAQTERIFYDGPCGLCQRFVRFVVQRDRAGTKFRFAPLQGPTFESVVPVERRAAVPDSMVVLTSDDRLLIRSNGVIHVLRRLGGFWKFIAVAISIIPRPLRDAVYDFIMRIRYRIFGRVDNVCPVTPPELRARFDD